MSTKKGKIIMCDCITSLDEALTSRVAKMGYKSAKVNKLFLPDKKLSVPEIFFVLRKANIKKNYIHHLIPHFCPFCGKKYETQIANPKSDSTQERSK